MRRIHPGGVLWLTVVWLLLWGEISPLLIATGVLAALVVLIVFPLPRLERSPLIAPWPTVLLLSRFLVDLVKASIGVAWLAVRPGPVVRGVVLSIDLRCEDDLLQTITAEMVALVPGTVVIDLDGPSGLLTLHAIGVRTPQEIDGVRRSVLAQEARVVRAFGRRDEMARVLGVEQ